MDSWLFSGLGMIKEETRKVKRYIDQNHEDF
jgi:hypothetical protein